MRLKLIRLRESMGFTQATFSAAIGTSRSHYSQIETGEKNPSLKLALAIKRALSYNDDDIFFDQKRPDTELIENTSG